jgi:hypothetical protein
MLIGHLPCAKRSDCCGRDEVALNAGLVCAEQDKHERGSHEQPAGMTTALLKRSDRLCKLTHMRFYAYSQGLKMR